MNEPLPHVISSEKREVMGLTIAIHKLSTGRHVIEHDDMHRVFEALEAGKRPSPEDWATMQDIALWAREGQN